VAPSDPGRAFGRPGDGNEPLGCGRPHSEDTGRHHRDRSRAEGRGQPRVGSRFAADAVAGAPPLRSGARPALDGHGEGATRRVKPVGATAGRTGSSSLKRRLGHTCTPPFDATRRSTRRAPPSSSRKVDDSLIPRLRKLPGLGAHHLIESGNGVITRSASSTTPSRPTSRRESPPALLNAVAGRWWRDPVAALVLVPYGAREALHGARRHTRRSLAWSDHMRTRGARLAAAVKTSRRAGVVRRNRR
jgi:hypothetical protein